MVSVKYDCTPIRDFDEWAIRYLKEWVYVRVK